MEFRFSVFFVVSINAVSVIFGVLFLRLIVPGELSVVYLVTRRLPQGRFALSRVGLLLDFLVVNESISSCLSMEWRSLLQNFILYIPRHLCHHCHRNLWRRLPLRELSIVYFLAKRLPKGRIALSRVGLLLDFLVIGENISSWSKVELIS